MTTNHDTEKTQSRTDKERIDKLTDEEIEKAAREDPDSVVPTDEELKEFKKPSESYRKRFQRDAEENDSSTSKDKQR